MIVAIVIVAIIVAATVYFVFPLRQTVDASTRAELTDIADNALQRIGRDVRLALPNSVRVTTSGSSAFVEFLAIRTAGRYRGQSSGAACGAATDELADIETHDEMVRLLQGLDPKQRAAVLLTAILDYSAEEAGRMLGIRASSVRSLTTRARARMKHEVVDPT